MALRDCGETGDLLMELGGLFLSLCMSDRGFGLRLNSGDSGLSWYVAGTPLLVL